MILTDKVYLQYENGAGVSVGLAPCSTYFLTECNEDLANEIVNKKIQYLDGKTHISQTLSSRKIELIGYLNVSSGHERMVRYLQRAFNLKLDGRLTYRNRSRNTAYTIQCRVTDLPRVELVNGFTWFTVNLECENPYWMGQSRTERIAMLNKCGRFPLGIPKPERFIFGYRANTLRSTFENAGDADASVRFIIEAESGSVTNPEITLDGDTPKTIKVIRAFAKGERVELINTPDKVSCIINGGENGMKYLTDDSKREWFYLQTGENTISYNAEANAINMKVTAEFTPLYLGVY